MSKTTKLHEQHVVLSDDQALVRALQRSQAIVEFTPAGVILSANDNFLKIMDCQLSDIAGKHHQIFCDADYACSDDYKAFWDKLGSGEFIDGEFKRLTGTGRNVWLRANYNPIIDDQGQVIKIVKVAMDVTSVRLAEAERKGLFEALSRSQALIEFDDQGFILYANQNYLRMMNYSLDDLVGKHHSILCEPALVKSKNYILFWEKLRLGIFERGDFKRVTKDGREIWVQASYNPIYDDSGNLLKIVKFASESRFRNSR